MQPHNIQLRKKSCCVSDFSQNWTCFLFTAWLTHLPSHFHDVGNKRNFKTSLYLHMKPNPCVYFLTAYTISLSIHSKRFLTFLSCLFAKQLRWMCQPYFFHATILWGRSGWESVGPEVIPEVSWQSKNCKPHLAGQRWTVCHLSSTGCQNCIVVRL